MTYRAMSVGVSGMIIMAAIKVVVGVLGLWASSYEEGEEK